MKTQYKKFDIDKIYLINRDNSTSDHTGACVRFLAFKHLTKYGRNPIRSIYDHMKDKNG